MILVVTIDDQNMPEPYKILRGVIIGAWAIHSPWVIALQLKKRSSIAMSSSSIRNPGVPWCQSVCVCVCVYVFFAMETGHTVGFYTQGMTTAPLTTTMRDDTYQVPERLREKKRKWDDALVRKWGDVRWCWLFRGFKKKCEVGKLSALSKWYISCT